MKTDEELFIMVLCDSIDLTLEVCPQSCEVPEVTREGTPLVLGRVSVFESAIDSHHKVHSVRKSHAWSNKSLDRSPCHA